MKIPYLDWATSTPKKYFKLLSQVLHLSISSTSFPVNTISSIFNVWHTKCDQLDITVSILWILVEKNSEFGSFTYVGLHGSTALILSMLLKYSLFYHLFLEIFQVILENDEFWCRILVTNTIFVSLLFYSVNSNFCLCEVFCKPNLSFVSQSLHWLYVYCIAGEGRLERQKGRELWWKGW